MNTEPGGAVCSPFTEEEEMYRASVRGFLDRELTPNAAKFVGNLEYDRAFWRKAGAAGLLGAAIPEQFGGPGASAIFTLADGAMAKLWIPEMSARLIDKAVQMFGGSGFMEEMPISKLYRANRLHRLYAGTSELQKVAIAKTL